MKLLLLTDLHAGESRESSTHPGIVRQANTETLYQLTSLVPLFKEIKFDLAIQMGDVIRDKDRITDILHFRNAFSELSKLEIPVISILGNHDAVNVSEAEICNLLREQRLETNFFGVRTIENFQFVWLDYSVSENGNVLIPYEKLQQVEVQLVPSSKKIVLSHYSLINRNMAGNFYFGGNSSNTNYANTTEILEFLHSHSIKLVVSGHDHWCSVKQDNGIHFVTLPSFSENITTSANSNQCPGIYSILETANDTITINSFSGEYSFFHVELAV